MHKSSPFLDKQMLSDAKMLFDRQLDLIDFQGAYGNASADSYLKNFRQRIVAQLAVDLALLRRDEGGTGTVLIVGGWPGITAMCLRAEGYSVTAVEHPSVVSDAMVKIFTDAGVRLLPLDIGAGMDGVMNASGEGYTLVECCECIEHWPFNPIPAVSNMLSALSDNGRLFLTVPNAASLFRRISLLFGRNVFPSISDFVLQMDVNTCADVSPHWREYTLRDLVELVRCCGGAPEGSAWRQFHARNDGNKLVRFVYDCCQFILPSARDHIGIIVKRHVP